MANNKTKKISIASFEKIMKDVYTPTKTVSWRGLDVVIKNTLSLKEVLTFVDNVTKICFTEDSCTYLPEIKDFAIKCCVLEMYANFTLPANIERRYDLVYCTDAVPVVMGNINQRQFNEIMDAINDKIDNLAQANIEAINRQMNELYSAFDNLQEQMSGIFAGIGTDEINTLINAISGDKLDETKFVQAYIDQKNGASKDSGEV